MYFQGIAHLQKQIGVSEGGSCLPGSSVNNQDCTKETPDSYNRFPLLTETPWQGPKNWLTARPGGSRSSIAPRYPHLAGRYHFIGVFGFFCNAFKFVGKEM